MAVTTAWMMFSRCCAPTFGLALADLDNSNMSNVNLIHNQLRSMPQDKTKKKPNACHTYFTY